MAHMQFALRRRRAFQRAVPIGMVHIDGAHFDAMLLRIAHELTNLNESLQALAYAALGQQGPQVRRRRSA